MSSINKAFPWGTYVGDLFADVSNDSYPVMLNTSQGGIRIEYDIGSEAQSTQLIENIALYIINQCALPIQVKAIDYSIRQPFHHLSLLDGNTVFECAAESSEATAQFNQLETLCRHRHHQLLTPKASTLSKYNKDAEYPEPYILWIINLNHYPDEFAPKRRIIELLSAAWEAGVYCIVYGQEGALADAPTVGDVFNKMPLIKLNNNQVDITEAVLDLVPDMSLYEFESINQNMDELLMKIASNAESNDTTDTQDEDFLRVQIGTSLDGRTPLYFSLGSHSQCYHAFISGTTGTGKSNLINNLLLGIAQQYSSDQVRLYLMDYKEGVEFQAFRDHPNCEKIFLNNDDLQAATDLLESFGKLIEQRGKQFKEAEVRDITEYNKIMATDNMPHIVLVIDEVHRLFSGSWENKDYFSSLLHDIARRGRSFGMHFILSTQTIEGTQIDKELMSQVGLRLSFKLTSPVDAERIFSFGNTAAYDLQAQNYEFVYNAEAGISSANVIGRASAPMPIENIIATAISIRTPSDCLQPEIVKGDTDGQFVKDSIQRQEGDLKNYKVARESTTDSTEEQRQLLKNIANKGLINENTLSDSDDSL